MKRTSTAILALSLAATGLLGIAGASTAGAATGTPWAGVQGYCDGQPVTSSVTQEVITLDNVAVNTSMKFTVKVPEAGIARTITLAAFSGETVPFDLAYGKTAHVTVTAGARTLLAAKAVTGSCRPAPMAPMARIFTNCVGTPKITSATMATFTHIDNVDSAGPLFVKYAQTGHATRTFTVAAGKSLDVKGSIAAGATNTITVGASGYGYAYRWLATKATANTCKVGAVNTTIGG